MRSAVCSVCGKHRGATEVVPAELVRPGLAELIRRDHPAWGRPGDTICRTDLNPYRARYIECLITEEKGELSALEQDVVRRLQQHEIVAADANAEFAQGLSLGDRLSDRVARFGGSWAFLLTFAGFLLVWMVINSVALLAKPFDPYPFILLNLVLSTLAAIQAPIIMMSQNRQEAKDRLRAEHDYRVNLKAELEIRLLGEKIDALVHHQWQRLLEIQEIQVELMQEINTRTKGAGPEKRP